MILRFVLVVAGACVGRDNRAESLGSHQFAFGSDDTHALGLQDTPGLGWLWPSDPACVDHAQISPDGHPLYATWAAGSCDNLAKAEVSRRESGVMWVDVRVHGRSIPLVCNASAIIGGLAINLDPPIDPASPPPLFDSTGNEVELEPYLE